MKIILLTLLFIPLATFAESIIRPKGTYEYIEKIVIKKMRIAETISHVSDVGRDRIKFLKDKGFLCVRKNQTVSICQKSLIPDETPHDILKTTNNYLKNAKFYFPGEEEATLFHDGADTEWIVREEILIGNKKMSAYKIVRKNDGNWFISLPVSEEQGIGVLEMISERELRLPLAIEKKENGQTVAYFFSAIFR